MNCFIPIQTSLQSWNDTSRKMVQGLVQISGHMSCQDTRPCRSRVVQHSPRSSKRARSGSPGEEENSEPGGKENRGCRRTLMARAAETGRKGSPDSSGLSNNLNLCLALFCCLLELTSDVASTIEYTRHYYMPETAVEPFITHRRDVIVSR
jgi:hypothetical protein